MLQISEALFEITLPRFSGDMLPKTDVGIVLSIADRSNRTQAYLYLSCHRNTVFEISAIPVQNSM